MAKQRNNQDEQPLRPYSPLQRGELAKLVAQQLLSQPCRPLREVVERRFPGAGVYAIYYQGSFELYKPLVEAGDFAVPIYVGKAEVEGRRTGKVNIESDTYCGENLYRRLRDHYKSINAAKNLDVNDFYCRFLVVEDIWIPLAEALLIQRFKPLWNVVVPGFGIHAPGRGRGSQKRSEWDMLHPGREFAEGLPEGTPVREIEKKIKQHLMEIFGQRS